MSRMNVVSEQRVDVPPVSVDEDSATIGTGTPTGGSWEVEETVQVPYPSDGRSNQHPLKDVSSNAPPHLIAAITVILLVVVGFTSVVIGNYVSRRRAEIPREIIWPEWPDSNITVGAYYYPWHQNDFHNGEGYVREELIPQQRPLLGEYDDSDPYIIEQHLAWSRQANVRVWITSWWGIGDRTDSTTKNVILNHERLGDHQIALFYETTGRIKEKEGYTTQRVGPDIAYICQQYFDHPNYLRIQGRPVLFVYLTRKLEENGHLQSVIDIMRNTASMECGHDIYIVGDNAFRGPPEEGEIHPPFEYLDAVTNYDNYGSMNVDNYYAGFEKVLRYYTNQRGWRLAAKKNDCSFIPAASPGYNDLGVRPEKRHAPLSRRIDPTAEPGSLFRECLHKARTLVDSDAGDLLMINSWNEFHEDTQIEPVIGTATTTRPRKLTRGIEYEGYGELYLDILRNETMIPNNTFV